METWADWVSSHSNINSHALITPGASLPPVAHPLPHGFPTARLLAGITATDTATRLAERPCSQLLWDSSALFHLVRINWCTSRTNTFSRSVHVIAASQPPRPPASQLPPADIAPKLSVALSNQGECGPHCRVACTFPPHDSTPGTTRQCICKSHTCTLTCMLTEAVGLGTGGPARTMPPGLPLHSRVLPLPCGLGVAVALRPLC